jgi:amino acid permease
MTRAGWIFLVASLTFVWALTLWCFYKVLSIREEPPDPVRGFHSA